MSEHVPTPRRVLVWRHGRTHWNVEHRFQGQADPPLDEVGRVQAAVSARLLVAYSPTSIISSDLARAVQTARPLAELVGLPVILDRRLRERSLGGWEGLTRDEVIRRHPEQFAQWVAGRDAPQPGAETRAELGERSLAALAGAEGETVVLVTHSATAMALTGLLLGLPMTGWRAVGPLGNGRWSEFTSDEHGWRLRGHNLGPLGSPITGLSTSDGSVATVAVPDAESVDAEPAR
ncbi:MAG TPA: histidine phosphatase family protein [Mycobacteriales bacterium]|jgi:probable phosphoglycerate mutase